MPINIECSDPFAAQGNWYKGCLHTHTTKSDGPLSPQETVDYYRKRGYQFLCITDHEKITDVTGLGGNDFLVLRGAEYGAKTRSSESVDVLGINMRKAIEEWTQEIRIGKIISHLKSQSSGIIIAHPQGYDLPLTSLSELKGCWGIEIFNAFFYLRDRERAYSTIHWDELLRRGQRIWGFASDDGHGYGSKESPEDSGFCWIMVKSPSLSAEPIFIAIEKGNFYASYGPTILDFRVEEGKCYGQTSPIKKVSLISNSKTKVLIKEDILFSQFDFSLEGYEEYLRLECVDRAGREAWTNPLFLEK